LHFTTQQLQGGGKYSVKSKIGNWYEDMVMDETKFKDYIKMKETNNLLVTKKEEKYADSLKKLEIAPFSEGFLTDGNYLLLQNVQTKGVLVVDKDDKNLNYDNAFAVTTNPLMNFPCPRSLIKIEKYSKSDTPVITYGEKILFVTHQDIVNQELYLYSSLISPQSYSRFSRNQEVLANSEKGYSSCWVIEHPDSTLRYSMEGRPIPINEAFVIRHAATGRLLASDLVDYYNDYGHEYEVCCNNFLTNNKYQTLVSEKEGKLKIDTKTRTEKDQNLWYAVDQI